MSEREGREQVELAEGYRPSGFEEKGLKPKPSEAPKPPPPPGAGAAVAKPTKE